MQRDESISPPPLKRQRISSTPSTEATFKSSRTHSLPSRRLRPLEPQLLRIFSWNINGISPFLQNSITSYFTSSSKSSRRSQNTKPLVTSDESENENEPKEGQPSLRACLRRWQWPHVVCLQEVKVKAGDEGTMRRVRAALKVPSVSSKRGGDQEREPGYSAFFALPKDRFNARGFGGKVYGVCMLIRDDTLESQNSKSRERRVVDVDWDLEGRVLKLKMRREKLVVFGVYAVNGTENPYKDPKTGLIAGTRHDRKRAFHTELRKEVKSYEQRGWSAVIVGDINVARTPADGFPGIRLGNAHVANRKDFEDKLMKPREAGGLGMLDSFRQLHGQERKYSYRPRGIPWGSSCDRVDLALLSGTAEDSLVEADILDDELERGPSDHVPLYVTLDLSRLPNSHAEGLSSALA